ncbi:MAG: hypothetical protein ACLFTK_09250 [Anaerolineales bacterium]
MSDDMPTPAPEPTDEAPAWLPERLERARRSAIQAVLDDLGYADVDALRAHLDEQAGHVQRLQADLDTAQAAHAAAQASARRAALDAAFQLSVAAHEFIDPAEARALLNWDAVHVDNAGAVHGMAEAVNALAGQRPHLLRRRATPSLEATRQGADGGFGPQTARELPPEQRDALRRRFKLR